MLCNVKVISILNEENVQLFSMFFFLCVMRMVRFLLNSILVYHISYYGLLREILKYYFNTMYMFLMWAENEKEKCL